jgi:hypothetical protein
MALLPSIHVYRYLICDPEKPVNFIVSIIPER